MTFVKKTPLEFNNELSVLYKSNVYLKREDLQTTRSFKIRGAYNKISKNVDSINHVVTCSAGNHAQGVAYVCNQYKINHTIFIPTCTPIQKQKRIEDIGKEFLKLNIIGNNFDESLKHALEFAKQNEYIFVHPFDDIDVIEGQSNVSKEIVDEIKPDAVVCCIGGGGMISGQLLYRKWFNKEYEYKIFGVEPENADGMNKSLKAKQIEIVDNLDTFVDGASVKRVGNVTFDICKNNKIENIFIVDNNKLCHTIVKLYQEHGIITEPAGALTVACLDKLFAFDSSLIGKNVVCIVSGGNNDVMRYSEFIERSLIYQGLCHYYIIQFDQRPGSLEQFVNKVLSGTSIDIKRFEYLKKTNKSHRKRCKT
jgi:threonine dehydratase